MKLIRLFRSAVCIQSDVLNTFNVLRKNNSVRFSCYVLSVKIHSLYMRTTQQVCVVNVDGIDAARVFIPENGRCVHHAFNVDSALNTTPSMKTQRTHNHIIPYYHWTSPVCCTQCARSTHTHTHTPRKAHVGDGKRNASPRTQCACMHRNAADKSLRSRAGKANQFWHRSHMQSHTQTARPFKMYQLIRCVKASKCTTREVREKDSEKLWQLILVRRQNHGNREPPRTVCARIFVSHSINPKDTWNWQLSWYAKESECSRFYNA